MTASSNQPGKLYGTAKTHTFLNLEDVDIAYLKFRPIISQFGTYTYNAAQVIGDYLKPLIEENDYIIRNTQDFPDMIKSQPALNNNEEYVSYDVVSLFTNIPIQETVDFILDEIYVKKKLPPFGERKWFKKLLLKLTTENTFVFNDKFYKQTDGCTMGGPLSVIMSNIFMTKLENDVVKPMRPIFYKRFVDDCINRRARNEPDVLLERLNSYHPKITFTAELSPEKFLDTKLGLKDTGLCYPAVYRKPNKISIHWSSKVPKRYKRNAVWGDLNRAYRMSSVFDKEVDSIRQKFQNACFPKRFVDSIIAQFKQKKLEEMKEDDEDVLIPAYLFECPKPFIMIEIPYSPENEQISKQFLHKFKIFTDDQYKVAINWKTKKVKNLFSLKSRNLHPACKIYLGVCSCNETYIGETKRNVEIRWGEHGDPRKASEPAKHIHENTGHVFTWNIIMDAPDNSRVRKNLEASWVALKKPSLNNQVDSKKLILFRHGVT